MMGELGIHHRACGIINDLGGHFSVIQGYSQGDRGCPPSLPTAIETSIIVARTFHN